MRKQRNMSSVKEQNKTPEKKLNKMETSNRLVQITSYKMLNDLRGGVDELHEKFNK